MQRHIYRGKEKQMKAILMAGGEGTRLRPITGGAPKPLVPLLGKSVMGHIIELLRRHGFDEICATLRYRGGDIIRAFGDGGAWGVRLRYMLETEPLGTAGGVKNCADFIGGEDVLVISGDAACDFDLAALWRAHRESGAAVTVALRRTSEPLRYGLAVTDERGRIRSFIEKPDWPHVVTDLVNTGIYVLSPRALDAIPAGRPYDFGRELFPALLASGEVLHGEVLEGYWRDIGTPLSYYQCCVDALEGRLQLTPGEAFAASPETPGCPEDTGLRCDCRDRAALMGTLSELFLPLGADFSDGIGLDCERFSLRIRPSATADAVCVDVRSPDAEFAKELTLSAKAVIDALNL